MTVSARARWWQVMFLGVWLCSSVSGAASAADSPAPLTGEERQALSDAAATGGLLHALDIRAAHATDLVLQRINPADHPNFVGWVVWPSGRDFTVSFYEREQDGFRLIADVAFLPDEPPSVTLAPEREVATEELSMLRARLAALDAVAPSCTPSVNTVVMPSRDPAEWTVYMLAATRQAGVMQVGGHARVRVAKADGRVLGTEALSRSCLAFDARPPSLPDGATPSAVSLSHVVSPLPDAIHVYLNLLHELPLVVSTARGLFDVRDGQVAPLGVQP